MSFLTGLNKAQSRAVNHFNGPLLVVAGAGSGKTRALTHRIAHLLVEHRIDPSEILAVTFTNKAAKEMKERLEILLIQKIAKDQYGQPFKTLSISQQNELQKRTYYESIKDLWIGTFHSLFARLLRFDIDKYTDLNGLQWTKQFSIYDESDVMSMIKEIVTKEMQIDPKRFEPKKVRWAISNAKNQCLLPNELEEKAESRREQIIAEAYALYRKALCANNALDFDDLLLIPVQLLQQNVEVRNYWHTRFKHILVDEYQDTNHTQYELIKLLITNGKNLSEYNSWNERSIFVVGDADQSIYSFRAADFRILMSFQEDFSLIDSKNSKSNMIKLEDNYRSTSTILNAANSLIQNNKERIEKVLRATRDEGSLIKIFCCEDEIDEAESLVHRIRVLYAGNPEYSWRNTAILYRTNAQSRAIEESLVRWQIPYVVIGGLRFYDRREIRDILAYLKVLVNPADNISLSRIINVPKRGIGKTTLQRLIDISNQLGISLWALLNDKDAVLSIGGRASKSLLNFSELINDLKSKIDLITPDKLIEDILDKSNYLKELIAEATDEAEERRRNLQELINASLQYQEETEDSSLENFLASVSLASDVDNKDTSADRITLMTLHSSKGLEFPFVFLVGMEDGLFPSFRSLDNTSSLEEERRLCYVGLTRAKDKLFLSHASERRTWGGMREPAIPSRFLSEIPNELVENEGSRYKNSAPTKVDSPQKIYQKVNLGGESFHSRNVETSSFKTQSKTTNWKVGDRVMHAKFGIGQITHTFGSDQKISIAVKFSGLSGPKILDPKLAPIELIN